MTAGASLVLEGNLVRGSELEVRLAALSARVGQVHCSAPLEVLIERYGSRTRHPGHIDHERGRALRDAVESGRHEPLDLPGTTIRIDTSEPIDFAELLDRVAEA